MNLWPFVTKKEHLKKIGELNDESRWLVEEQKLTNQIVINALERQLVDLSEFYYEQLERNEKQIDDILKELTTYKISRSTDPPYDTELTVTLDSHIIMQLRDPALGPWRNESARIIADRMATLIKNTLIIKGTNPTEGWQ